jgi:hypothetical protein
VDRFRLHRPSSTNESRAVEKVALRQPPRVIEARGGNGDSGSVSCLDISGDSDNTDDTGVDYQHSAVTVGTSDRSRCGIGR